MHPITTPGTLIKDLASKSPLFKIQCLVTRYFFQDVANRLEPITLDREEIETINDLFDFFKHAQEYLDIDQKKV